MAGGEMIDNVVHAAIVMTTPVLLAAIGGLVNRVGGFVNIGLDSMMLAGALLGLIIASSTGSWSAALVMAALVGGVLGLLMSLAVTRLDANEIIVGLGFNIAVAGLVRFFLKSAYGSSGTLNLPDVARLPRIDIPVVADIPILGAVLSGHDPVTWAAWLMVPLTAWFLARTRAGLRLRAAGAAPQAARALGLSPLALRDASTVFAGLMAGLAGAYLSIGVVGIFNEGITAGRGFIALAAFYFGRNRPWQTALGALLFGFFDAFQIRLQGQGRSGGTRADAALRDGDRGAHAYGSGNASCSREEGLKMASKDKTALILVDAINSFFEPGHPNYYPDVADVIPAMRALLDAARASDRHRGPRGRETPSRLRRFRVEETAGSSSRRCS